MKGLGDAKSGAGLTRPQKVLVTVIRFRASMAAFPRRRVFPAAATMCVNCRCSKNSNDHHKKEMTHLKLLFYS